LTGLPEIHLAIEEVFCRKLYSHPSFPAEIFGDQQIKSRVAMLDYVR
jgi:hypothetical protein